MRSTSTTENATTHVDSLHDYLRNSGIPLSPNLRHHLTAFQSRSFRKGEFIAREGAVSGGLDFLLSGIVRHYYLVDDKEITRWVSLSGHFMTSFKSFVGESPSAVNLVAAEPVEVLRISRTDFYALLADFAEMKSFWIRCLENEMVKYEDRVSLFITAESRERYLHFLEHYPQHAQQVPLKYIASLLGMQPRHLSRIRKELAAGE